MNRFARRTALCFSIALPAGCNEAADTSSNVVRSFHFDGVEVTDILEDEPNTAFFVDLRGGNQYTFDPREEMIPFERFIVQCPSMGSPMSMLDFFQLLDLDLEQEETPWSLVSAEDNEIRFRTPDTCEYACGPDGGDCVKHCLCDMPEIEL